MSDEARELLKQSAAKIDQSLVQKNKDTLSHVAFGKMLRLVDEHGRKGVTSVKFMPNWNEGATPRHLPTGYVMLFDVKSAKVVPEAFPSEMMYAGTMAFQIPPAQLQGSALSTTGHSTAQILERVKNAVQIDKNLDDAYTGLYMNKKRGARTFEHTYWVVTRSVDQSLNDALAAKIESYAGQPMSAMLSDTKTLRQSIFEKQRRARAENVVQLMSSVGVSGIDALRVLESDANLIDNVCFSLTDNHSKDSATLYSDAVNVQSNKTVSSGLVLSGSIELGPTVLRGERTSATRLDAFPSTTGTTMPLWEAVSGDTKLELGEHSRMSESNLWAWSGSLKHNVLLARNAFRPRDNAWLRIEQSAGFSEQRSLLLEPVAVKITNAIGK